MHLSSEQSWLFFFWFEDWLFWRRFKATENSFITETSSITWKLSLSCHGFWQCTFAFPLATSHWTIKGLLTTRLLCLIVWLTGGQGSPSLHRMMAKMQSVSVVCSNLVALLEGVLWRQSWLQKVWGNLQGWIWLCITCNVSLSWHGTGRCQGPLGEAWCHTAAVVAGLTGGGWLLQKVWAWLSGARSSCSG